MNLPPSPDSLKAPSRRIVAVIPARLASSRLPGKVLLPIAGVPMLGWVYRAALACRQLDQVLIATDSKEVADYANSEHWPVIMTSANLASGTDRVHAASALADADIYVNLQGDEPLLRPEHIDALLLPFERSGAEVTTLSTPCPPDQIHNPNAVKVVAARDGRALYFSRSTIPYHRDGGSSCQKHLGLYAYRKDALDRFAALRPSPLELTERLEQLRLLENGISIYVEQTAFDTIGVDTEEDRTAAERILRARAGGVLSS
ncbi:MAG TPA: 3-deoxy-manno-octulosonate cytidylyltransferase [Acidobacteriaceae bacterium]|nr:3-deoxy-manno-octulosonate cytidylyltransferase [Acidobacteriaceae bacterium]